MLSKDYIKEIKSTGKVDKLILLYDIRVNNDNLSPSAWKDTVNSILSEVLNRPVNESSNILNAIASKFIL